MAVTAATGGILAVLFAAIPAQHLPQLSSPRVSTTWGFSAPIGIGSTLFEFSVTYRDIDGDLPRSIELVLQGGRYQAKIPASPPRGDPRRGIEVEWPPVALRSTGLYAVYTVEFRAADKDGQAVSPGRWQITVINWFYGAALAAFLGWLFASVVAGRVLSRIMWEVSAAAVAWVVVAWILPVGLLSWLLRAWGTPVFAYIVVTIMVVTFLLGLLAYLVQRPRRRALTRG